MKATLASGSPGLPQQYLNDDYGFLLNGKTPHQTAEAKPAYRHGNNAAAFPTVAAATSSLSAGFVWPDDEQLCKEESWWASDFLLYLSWRAAHLPSSTPSALGDGGSAPAPAAREADFTETRAPLGTVAASGPTDQTDAWLIDRWFWTRWEARLRQHGSCFPMPLRGLLWGFFSGAWQRPAADQQREFAAYASFCHADEHQPEQPSTSSSSPSRSVDEAAAALDAIDRDIGRTFPHHLLFYGTGDTTTTAAAAARSCGQSQLRRLLRAYAVRDREVGYCQGMAFVAAVLLMVAPEAQAYAIFCALMGDGDGGPRDGARGRRLGMRQLYRSGFPLLQTLLAELESHVRLLLPALAAHLRSAEVHVGMFASQWFLTLFVHQLPPSLLLRVWDYFMLRGWTVMVQVAVALLHQEQAALMQLGLEGILLHLKEVRSRRQNEEELLRRVCSIPLLS